MVAPDDKPTYESINRLMALPRSCGANKSATVPPPTAIPADDAMPCNMRMAKKRPRFVATPQIIVKTVYRAMAIVYTHLIYRGVSKLNIYNDCIGLYLLPTRSLSGAQTSGYRMQV